MRRLLGVILILGILLLSGCQFSIPDSEGYDKLVSKLTPEEKARLESFLDELPPSRREEFTRIVNKVEPENAEELEALTKKFSEGTLTEETVEEVEIIEPETEAEEIVIVEVPEEEKVLDKKETMLRIHNQDWVALVNLEGFTHMPEDDKPKNQFLQYKKGNIFVNVYARKAEKAQDSKDCAEKQEPEIEKDKKSKEEEAEDNLIRRSFLSKNKRDTHYVISYDLAVKSGSETNTHKDMHSFVKYEDYCFDIHILELGFIEEHMKTFNDVLDSFRFVQKKDLEEKERPKYTVYV